MLVLFAGTATWLKAGTMQIVYTSDPDVEQTGYPAHCDSVVMKYLGKKEAGRLTTDRYLDMIRELRVCSRSVATPGAK